MKFVLLQPKDSSCSAASPHTDYATEQERRARAACTLLSIKLDLRHKWALLTEEF